MYLLIGIREQFHYNTNGKIINTRTYIYAEVIPGSTENIPYYEVINGKVEQFSKLRPYNVYTYKLGTSRRNKVYVKDITVIPDAKLVPNIRYKNKPVIHLVYGSSGLGKSTIFINHSNVYETDCSEELQKECLSKSIILT